MARAGIPLLAVLIDADNSSPQWAEAIFEEIASLGEASVRRIYGDFSRSALKGWSDRLAGLALVPHHQPANTIGKNSSDIALVIDAMDILHSGRFDGFVLVSSDSDFTRLASRIREQGLDVYGIGQRKTPEAFRKACKRFIFVENLMAPPEMVMSPVAVPVAAAVPASVAAVRKPAVTPVAANQPLRGDADILPPFITGAPLVIGTTDSPEAHGRKEPAANAVALVMKALIAMNSDEDWVGLGQLGQYIATINPDFDPRSYGSPKLSDLLIKSGAFEMRKGDGNQTFARVKPKA